MNIGIIGLGKLGKNLLKFYNKKKINLFCFDKYFMGGIGNLNKCLLSDIIIICVPVIKKNIYDLSEIEEICKFLNENNYKGGVILKSNLEPNTTNNLYNKFKLNLVHSPSFLNNNNINTEIENPKQIILGIHPNINKYVLKNIIKFHVLYYNKSKLSICKTTESECLILFMNSFYATKIQLLNSYYLLSKKLGLNYSNIKDMILFNQTINTNHTNILGNDNKLGFNGKNLPNDTKILKNYMDKNNIPFQILDSVINERNLILKYYDII